MSISLQSIQAPVEAEVARFHQEIERILSSKSTWLAQAVEVLNSSTGKRVRPIMTSLMAGMLSPVLPKKAIDSAILLELIHTATLVHDDVIDEAKTRRGKPTLGVIFDNRVAVLMGDFILSSALVGAMKTGDLRIISIISSLGRDLTEGEIRQAETAEAHILSEEVYTDIIRQKTAVLFRACAEVAAICSNRTSAEIEELGLCGEYIGLAFQIRDDIFDYHTEDVGKPVGNDIREGKVTLPLLHALLNPNTPKDEAEHYHAIIQRGGYSAEEINDLILFAKRQGGMTYAQECMHTYLDRARDIILRYPDNAYRTALIELVNFIAQRSI